MNIPRIIEYIQSLRTPDGRRMSELGAHQIMVPVWPAGTILATTVSPPDSTYAWIGYGIAWNPNMVPGAFIGSVYHGGAFLFDGTLTAAVLASGVSSFTLITRAAPIRYWSQNITALNQYEEVIGAFCVVSSREDMEYIQKKLDDLAMTNWGELRDEALAVLRVISGREA